MDSPADIDNRTGTDIIDSDLHCTLPSVGVLVPYLSDHWREFIRLTDFKGAVDQVYPPGAPITALPESFPPDGRPPGSSLDLLRQQALDPWQTSYGILSCVSAIESIHNPDGAAAIASAINDWVLAEWVAADPRLRASLIVPSQQPEMAAREIDRLGVNPKVVQVSLPVRSSAPYGNRRYHPIFAAAARHDLVVGLHFGGAPGLPSTPAGWPSYYIEEYAGMAQVFQSQLFSLIVEGVFDRFPTLRVALLESGVTWLPSFMWRLDKEWKGLRREVPWVKHLPSEYIRQHVRLSSQPFDAPSEPRSLQQILEQIGAGDLLMFATDYPHRHNVDGKTSSQHFLDLPIRARRDIMYENARAFYRI